MRILEIIRDYHPKPTPHTHYTGVRKRQREGTLERVLKYDKVALEKAYAWMAASPSDSEDD